MQFVLLFMDAKKVLWFVNLFSQLGNQIYRPLSQPDLVKFDKRDGWGLG